MENKNPIRSYVVHGRGRLTPAQKRAYESLLPAYGIPFRHAELDFAAIFGRAAPTIFEIGSGMGEATADIALRHPENNYLAAEVFKPGIGSLLRRIEENNIRNLRVIHHDAVEVLQYMIPDASLAGVHIFFPDPWPKKRHHKRRLIQPPFVDLLCQKLQPGGYVHVATDWENYAEQIRAVLEDSPCLTNAAMLPDDPLQSRPQTKFERRGKTLQHEIQDFYYRRESG